MAKSCSFDECGRPAIGHGLCQSHCAQRRTGKPLRPIQARGRYGSSVERDSEGRKRCARCEQWLAPSSYTADKSKADGLTQWCRPCAALYKLEWRYGLPTGGVGELLESQQNRCAICAETFSAGRRFYIDHDHRCCPGDRSCGRCVRGLLCNRCNIVAGYLDQNDDAERFFAYITGHRAAN